MASAQILSLAAHRPKPAEPVLEASTMPEGCVGGVYIYLKDNGRVVFGAKNIDAEDVALNLIKPLGELLAKLLDLLVQAADHFICRIGDLFHHHQGDQRVDFVWEDFVDGV